MQTGPLQGSYDLQEMFSSACMFAHYSMALVAKETACGHCLMNTVYFCHGEASDKDSVQRYAKYDHNLTSPLKGDEWE